MKVILPFLAAAALAETRFVEKTVDISCDDHRDGYVPHPTDCTRYFRCAAGLAYKFRCPQTKFDLDPANEEYLFFHADSETCTFESDCGTEEDRVNSCKGKFGDGKFAAKEDNQYFTCTGGVISVDTCPVNQKFHAFKRECVDPAEANFVSRADLLANPKPVDVADTIIKHVTNSDEKPSFIKEGDSPWRPAIHADSLPDPEPETPADPVDPDSKVPAQFKLTGFPYLKSVYDNGGRNVHDNISAARPLDDILTVIDAGADQYEIKLSTFKNNAPAFTDVGFYYTDVPDHLNGMALIKTAKIISSGYDVSLTWEPAYTKGSIWVILPSDGGNGPYNMGFDVDGVNDFDVIKDVYGFTEDNPTTKIKMVNNNNGNQAERNLWRKGMFDQNGHQAFDVLNENGPNKGASLPTINAPGWSVTILLEIVCTESQAICEHSSIPDTCSGQNANTAWCQGLAAGKDAATIAAEQSIP